jgi:hypothetical protein
VTAEAARRASLVCAAAWRELPLGAAFARHLLDTQSHAVEVPSAFVERNRSTRFDRVSP